MRPGDPLPRSLYTGAIHIKNAVLLAVPVLSKSFCIDLTSSFRTYTPDDSFKDSTVVKHESRTTRLNVTSCKRLILRYLPHSPTTEPKSVKDTSASLEMQSVVECRETIPHQTREMPSDYGSKLSGSFGSPHKHA